MHTAASSCKGGALGKGEGRVSYHSSTLPGAEAAGL